MDRPTNYFDYNPFEDIEQNGTTIWQLDVFEEPLPPLIADQYNQNQTTNNIHNEYNDSSESIDCHTSGQQTGQPINRYMQTFSQSIDCLDDKVLQPIEVSDDLIHYSFASGDCQELWRMAADSQTMANTEAKKKDKKLKVYSLHPKSNLIRFPEKLWKIISECKTGAIKWSADGKSILINYYLFQIHYLNDFKHFKTKNISSFVRQLNLYGFHKLGLKPKKRTNNSPTTPISSFVINGQNLILSSVVDTSVASIDSENEWHEFQCQHFVRDHKELLNDIKRKYPNQPNDENSIQLTQKTLKCGRKPLKQLNGKNRAKESKPMTKGFRKQSFEANLNSINYSKSGINYKQNNNCFNYYSFDMIFTQNCGKTSGDFNGIIDKSLATVLNNKSRDPLLH